MRLDHLGGFLIILKCSLGSEATFKLRAESWGFVFIWKAQVGFGLSTL